MAVLRCLIAVLMLAGVPIVLLGPARGAPEATRSALRLPVDTSAARLAVAADAIRKEDWERATTALQALLDRKDDAVVSVVRTDGNGRKVKTFVSVRGEARRLLRTLPAAGRAFYEATYNPRANALLRAALKANRPEALAAVADRFEELLSLVTNEPGVEVRRDAWVKARIAGLLHGAPDLQRQEIEEEIANRLKGLQRNKSFARLPAFIRLFGPESAAGREARLLWAVRLIARGKDLPSADRALQEVRDRRDDPARVARALAMLAWLQRRRGLPADAVYYYRVLARDYPSVVAERGKTGEQLYDEITGDERFRLHVALPGAGSWGRQTQSGRERSGCSGGQADGEAADRDEPAGPAAVFRAGGGPGRAASDVH